MREMYFLALSQFTKIDEICLLQFLCIASIYFVASQHPNHIPWQGLLRFSQLYSAFGKENIMSPQFNTFYHKHLASLVTMLIIGVTLCIPQNDAFAQVRGRFSLTGNIVLPASTSTLIGTLNGVELRLVNSSGATVDVVSIGSSGAYLFSNVTTGVFTVIPRRVGGTNSGSTFSPTSATIELTSGTTSTPVSIPNFLMQLELPVISGRMVMLHDYSICQYHHSQWWLRFASTSSERWHI
jgi:hypothetical protein